MTIYSQSEVKTRTNQIIHKVLQQQRLRAVEVHAAYAQLWQTIDDLIMAGGKRMRPYLTYIAHTLFADTNNSDIFTIAAAQEFLHFALLIHDDIIDRDTIRYGQKNIMGQYESIYAAAKDNTDHFASGAALMAGDLALAQAYDLINQSALPASKKFETIRYLSQSIFYVAGGELLDMEATFRQPCADYFTIAQHKTARYSFVGPLLTGANIASAPALSVTHLTKFGLNLGIAYQLADDLLGLYGNQESIGKPIISDLREGKKTHLFEVIQQLSSPADHKYFSQVWGNPQVTVQDVNQVRQIGIHTGAKSRVEELMRQYARQSLQSLNDLSVASDRTQPLRQLANKVVNQTF